MMTKRLLGKKKKEPVPYSRIWDFESSQSRSMIGMIKWFFLGVSFVLVGLTIGILYGYYAGVHDGLTQCLIQ